MNILIKLFEYYEKNRLDICKNRDKLLERHKIFIFMLKIYNMKKEILLDIISFHKKVNLLSYCKKDSQIRIIAKIFHNNENIPLKKRDIEKEYVFRVMFKNIDCSNMNNINISYKQLLCPPGDVQRDLRLFFDRFKRYGLEKNGTRENIVYTWKPLFERELYRISPYICRNLYSLNERKIIIEQKINICEICDKSDDRMCIDHWRAYNTYRINDKKLGIVLCEKCNNIHSDRDSIKIVEKNLGNINILEKWSKIEYSMRLKGFIPNTFDAEYQNQILDICKNFFNNRKMDIFGIDNIDKIYSSNKLIVLKEFILK